MCICHTLIEYSIFGINSQHSMLYFPKENTVLLNNKFQLILATTMLSYLVINNIFVSDLYTEYIADMKCQIHPFTFGAILYSTKT